MAEASTKPIAVFPSPDSMRPFRSPQSPRKTKFVADFTTENISTSLAAGAPLEQQDKDKLMTLKTLIPERVVQWYIDKLESKQIPERVLFVEQFHGAVLFADISGFTKMTATIEREQPYDQAKEIVAQHIGMALNKMVTPIVKAGGDIIKFAGDAVFAVFTASALGSLENAVHIATSVAFRLSQLRVPVPGGQHVTVHCGVGCGEAMGFHVGGILNRWEYAITGDPVTQATTAESAAGAGDAVVSRDVKQMSDHIAEFEPLGDADPDTATLFRVVGVSFTPLEDVVTPVSSYLHDVEDVVKLKAIADLMRPYVPRPVLERIDEGGDIFIREHRRCTTLFIRILGLPHNTTDDVHTVHNAVRGIQKHVYSYVGATMCRFIMDEKGCCIFAVFGLPPFEEHAHPTRGVLAAMELHESMANCADWGDTPLAVSIGITYGWVFAGTVGGTLRAEYTLHGSAVNLAARLMVKSEQGIFCDDQVHAHTHNSITYSEPIEISVKGTDTPIRVYRPLKNLDVGEAKAIRQRVTSRTLPFKPLRRAMSAPSAIVKITRAMTCCVPRNPTNPTPPHTFFAMRSFQSDTSESNQNGGGFIEGSVANARASLRQLSSHMFSGSNRTSSPEMAPRMNSNGSKKGYQKQNSSNSGTPQSTRHISAPYNLSHPIQVRPSLITRSGGDMEAVAVQLQKEWGEPSANEQNSRPATAKSGEEPVQQAKLGGRKTSKLGQLKALKVLGDSWSMKRGQNSNSQNDGENSTKKTKKNKKQKKNKKRKDKGNGEEGSLTSTKRDSAVTMSDDESSANAKSPQIVDRTSANTTASSKSGIATSKNTTNANANANNNNSNAVVFWRRRSTEVPDQSLSPNDNNDNNGNMTFFDDVVVERYVKPRLETLNEDVTESDANI